MTEEKNNKRSELILESFIKENLEEVKYPIAYYEENLDSIFVFFEDCSYAEEKANIVFYVFKRNYSESVVYVGFSIEQIKLFFDKLGLKMEGVVKLRDIVDSALKKYPNITIQWIVNSLYRKEVDSLEIVF